MRWIAAGLLAVLLVVLPSFAGDFYINLASQILIAAIFGYSLSLTVHEMAHALATKSYGRKVPRGGFMVMMGMPYAFVDTTDMWFEGSGPRIVVNGREYDNFERVIERIQATEAAWRDLASYQESSAIHGDLTIDNILVDMSSRDVLVIDPSDDNQVRGPIIDFARLG